MDIKEYISSGILESYVLGHTSEAEAKELEILAKKHPEVQEELDAIRAALETYAVDFAVAPPAQLKARILDSIFKDDDSVFTLSLHGDKNFPFRKEASDLDIALPDGCGDADYLAALEQGLLGLEAQCSPGFVLYLAGADPFERDRLGRLKLTFDGLMARDRRVFDWCYARRIPMAFAMGGGYGLDIAETVQVQLNTYSIATEYWLRWQRQHSRVA